MPRCTYRCNQKHFEDYYTTQVGRGLSVFAGAPYQRGYGGLGNILSGLTRSVVPLLKAGGKVLLKEGAKTGARLAKDLLAGRTLSSSVKRRGKEAGGRLLNQALHRLSPSSSSSLLPPTLTPPGRRPIKRRKTQSKRQKTKRSKADHHAVLRQPRLKDIFN